MIALATAAAGGVSAEQTPVAARPAPADGIAASVVKVTVFASAADPFAPWQRQAPQQGVGSGVIVAGERILTAAHVVSDAATIEVQRQGVGRRYAADVEHRCDACDLALLRVRDSHFFEGTLPLELGELPQRQQQVEVYGFSEGGEGLAVTAGIVSRVELDYYVHSTRRLLLAQVDAAVHPGNSGGPAISGGRIVGIAVQTREDQRGTGQVVPAPVVRHFLDDVADGRFDGVPELGIEVQALENAALRRRLGLSDEEGGVLVTAVSRRGAAHGALAPGDVILALDGLPVLESDDVELEPGLALESLFLEQRVQTGHSLRVDLVRGGERLSRRVRMRPPEDLVPAVTRLPAPSYRVYAGLVFQTLTFRYLQAVEEMAPELWSWWQDSMLHDGAVLGREAPPMRRDEVVVLTGLLASEVTMGYEVFQNEVVHAVDGVPVTGLAQLSHLLDRARGEFVEIALEHGGRIVLDRAEAERRSPQILARYGVPADRSSDLAPLDAKGP